MIKDELATFASAQTTTTSVAHTDVINTSASGDAYVGSWFVFQVSTAFTQGGTLSRLTVQLQTCDNADFVDSSSATLAQSNTYATASLTAGKFWAVRVPPGVKKYLRAYNSVSGTTAANYFTGGAWNSFLTPDIDLELNKRYMLT